MASAPGMDITESARRVGALAWTEARLFEVVGGWAASTPEPTVKLLFARASRQHGDHALALAAVLPETRDHDPGALVAPSEGEVTRALAGVDGTAARLSLLVEAVLPAQVVRLERFLDVASTLRDGPARRVVGDVVRDDRAILEEADAARRHGDGGGRHAR